MAMQFVDSGAVSGDFEKKKQAADVEKNVDRYRGQGLHRNNQTEQEGLQMWYNVTFTGANGWREEMDFAGDTEQEARDRAADYMRKENQNPNRRHPEITGFEIRPFPEQETEQETDPADELRKYEATGSVLDAIQRFDRGLTTGDIPGNDDLHGKEIEGLRRYLAMRGQEGQPFAAMIAAYKMGYMRRYDAEQ